MNELKNTEQGSQPSEKEPLTRGMLFLFIALLISALLLSGTMLFHYAPTNDNEQTQTSSFDFNNLLEQSKQTSAKLSEQTQKKISETTKSLEEKSAIARAEKKARWPKLKLTGFGKSVDGKGGFAIINGDQYNIGEPAGKISLIAIHPQGVMVEYKGEQKMIYPE